MSNQARQVQACQNGKEFSRLLSKQENARRLRQCGSHEVWDVNGHIIVNPVHNTMGKGLRMKIIKAIVTALGLAVIFIGFISVSNFFI